MNIMQLLILYYTLQNLCITIQIIWNCNGIKPADLYQKTIQQTTGLHYTALQYGGSWQIFLDSWQQKYLVATWYTLKYEMHNK